jgi:signal peptide peptidase SppA
MELTDFSKGQLWSILPDKFDLLYQKFFEMQAEDFKAQIGGQGGDERPYRVTDGLAVIPITGPLTKRMSFFSVLFGGSSYEKISSDFKMAIEDEEVRGIVLDIDSPGGTVSGAEGLADLVFNSRGEKPIIAFANGLMASAAYWIGSAADAIIAENTSVAGSIGVLMIHTDYSELEKKMGVKTTYLSAGSYKAMGNSSQPLSDQAKDYFQSQLNYVYSIFVETVARNRDVEVDRVLIKMADGKTFIGQQAKDAGLVDEIGGLDVALALASSMMNENYQLPIGGFSMDKKDQNKIETVDVLTAAFPELVMEAQDKAVEAVREKTRQEAITEERDRIIELVDIQFGEEQAAGLRKVIEEGVTSSQLKAIKALSPEPAEDDPEDLKKDEMLKAIQDSGADNPGADGDQGDEKDFMVRVEEYKLVNKCRLIDAIGAISRQDPKAHEAYIRRVNA